MGFRNPVRTAQGIDTNEDPNGAGVRLYQETAGDPQRGVLELRAGAPNFDRTTLELMVYLRDVGIMGDREVYRDETRLTAAGINGTGPILQLVTELDDFTAGVRRTVELGSLDLLDVAAPIAMHTGTRTKRIGLDPVSADRITGINGLPVNANSFAVPTGASFTLPALPVGHVVVLALNTDFYIDGAGTQSLRADINAVAGATRTAGHGHSQVSAASLTDTVRTVQTWRIDQTGPVSFSTRYTTGLGSTRAVLLREDWTAWC
jgi:hypothetical protein